MPQTLRSIVVSRWLTMAVAIITLAGCGGGGGGGSSGAATAASVAPVTSADSSAPVTSQSSAPATVGEATLSWMAPDENTDGSALTNLAGYRIYYGTSAAALDQVIDIPTVGITTYVVDSLTSGTYYFSIRAYNAAGAESALSNIVSTTIS
jgi:hypothetical protein